MQQIVVSQSEIMDLMQKRRLDPGTALKAIHNKKKEDKNFLFNNLKALSILRSSRHPNPIFSRWFT